MKIHLLGGMLVLCAILSGCSSTKPESEVSFIERPSTSMPTVSTESESIDDLKNGSQSSTPDYVKPGQWSFDLTEPEPPSELDSSATSEESTTSEDSSTSSEEPSSIISENSSEDQYASKDTSFDGFTYEHLLRNGEDYFSFPTHETVILDSTDTEFLYSVTGTINGTLEFRDPTTFAAGVTQRMLLEQESRDLIYQWDKTLGDPISLGVMTLSSGTEVEVFHATNEGTLTISFAFVQCCNDMNWLCGNLSSRGIERADFDVLLSTVKYMGYPEVFDSVSSVLSDVFQG